MPAERLRQTALTVWTIVGVVTLGYVALVLADSVRIVWIPIAFAAGLVFLLEPLVKGLERVGVHRIIGTFVAFIVLVATVVAVSALVFPTVQAQALEFIERLPELYTGLIDWLRDVGGRLGWDVDSILTRQNIEEWLNDPTNQETLQNLLSGAGIVLRGVTEAVAIIALAPVLAIYMLLDLPKFKANAYDLTPRKHRDEVVYVGTQVGIALGSFVRGQLLVALIVGIASSAGMWLIDLPFWLLVGILAGFLNLIPFLGPIVGGALAALVALLNGDPTQALLAVAIFTGIQQVDNHVITPMIQRTRVNLSPLVIVLALVIGGSVAGLLGVLIAVPLTAAVRILVGHLWRTRVLGQSWSEAAEAMIEVTEPPERLARYSRKGPDQSRLFDTQEMSVLQSEDVGGGPEAPNPNSQP